MILGPRHVPQGPLMIIFSGLFDKNIMRKHRDPIKRPKLFEDTTIWQVRQQTVAWMEGSSAIILPNPGFSGPVGISKNTSHLMNACLGKLSCLSCRQPQSWKETGPTQGRFYLRWCRNSSTASQGNVSAIVSQYYILISGECLNWRNLKVCVHEVEHHNAVLAPIVTNGHTLRGKP